MIEKLITSKDGEVLAATVRTVSGKLLNRALNFLYPLECSELSDKLAKETVADKEKQDDPNKQKSRQELVEYPGLNTLKL